MDWQRLTLSTLVVLTVWIVSTIQPTEGSDFDVKYFRGRRSIVHLSLSAFVSCSPNPCENGARCIKNSLGSARCE